MKKTKKKQVCGAACFMAAEIKFSKDVRPSVHPSVRPRASGTRSSSGLTTHFTLQQHQMTTMASRITSQLSVCSAVCLRLKTKKHQRSALLSLCEGNPSVIGGFPAQRDNYAENVLI